METALDRLQRAMPFNEIVHEHFSDSYAAHTTTTRLQVDVKDGTLLIVDQIRTFLDKSTAASDLEIYVEMRDRDDTWKVIDADLSVTANTRSTNFNGPFIVTPYHSIRIRTVSDDGTSRTISGFLHGRVVYTSSPRP